MHFVANRENPYDVLAPDLVKDPVISDPQFPRRQLIRAESLSSLALRAGFGAKEFLDRVENNSLFTSLVVVQVAFGTGSEANFKLHVSNATVFGPLK
jgi:hypothetical protein